MSCQLNDSQIQSWLDGDSDESPHLADCPECQQRMLSMQKLRSRLVPPPSPLGRDFARRTAQHVLRVSDVIKPNKPAATGWWSRLRDNPLCHVVQRERARRMFRLPGLAAILLLYLVPGGFVFQSGDADASWAYFGMVRIGLTLLVPLFLLSLEWTSLSALVRGRCLEEMLQTGLEPALVSDTLALSGVRSLLPALLMVGLALLPVHPQSLLVWPPLTLVAFSAAGYLSQAHLLGLHWPRWLSFLGASAVAGSLAAPAPWNLVSATVLTGLGLAARRQSVSSLELQQQGRLPAPRRNRGSAWQIWLARRLPDLALLQRELRRRNLLITPSILAGNLGVCLAAYTAFGKNAYSWPLLAGVAGLLAAFSLVQREKDGGAYEVLLHSGLRPQDFWASAVWIAGLQFLPACLAGVTFTFVQFSTVSWVSAAAAALGTLLSLFVSLRAGAVIGATIGVASQNSRQASTRCVQEAAVLSLLSLMLLGLVPPLVGAGSPLSMFLETLGLSLSDAMDGVSILPVMLALHLRARSLAGPSFGFNPWTYSLALLAPVCIWVQIVLANFYPNANSQANSCTGMALLIGLVWAWWAAPLASNPGKQRWMLLSLSYTAALLLGIPVSMWALAYLGSFRAEVLPVGLSQLDNLQLVTVVVTAAWLIYLLGRRLTWKSESGQDLHRRTFWAGGISLAVVGCFAQGMLSLARSPRPHAAEFAAFLARHDTPAERRGSTPLDRILKTAKIYDTWGAEHWRLSERLELYAFAPYETRFQELLGPLLVDPGLQKDRMNALWVLYLQADQALYRHQPELYLELLKKMTVLAVRSETTHPDSTRVVCPRLRSQVFLAARSQAWTPSQLDRLDRLQASLPDGPSQLRAARDQSAANHYMILRKNRWEDFQDFQSSSITRFFMRHQADIFLDSYLAGRMGQTGQSLAQSHLFQVTRWQAEGTAGRQILIECDRLAIDLERWKLEHEGKYPAIWTEARKGIRLAYQPTGDSYYLKVWIARIEGPPAILTSQGPEFRLSSPYY